jgi:hypothetical protein
MKKILIALALTIGCTQINPNVPPYHEPNDDELCEPACKNMRDVLHCSQGENIDDHTTCEQFCHYMTKNGHGMNNACRIKVKTCQEIDTTCRTS